MNLNEHLDIEISYICFIAKKKQKKNIHKLSYLLRQLLLVLCFAYHNVSTVGSESIEHSIQCILFTWQQQKGSHTYTKINYVRLLVLEQL